MEVYAVEKGKYGSKIKFWSGSAENMNSLNRKKVDLKVAIVHHGLLPFNKQYCIITAIRKMLLHYKEKRLFLSFFPIFAIIYFDG